MSGCHTTSRPEGTKRAAGGAAGGGWLLVVLLACLTGVCARPSRGAETVNLLFMFGSEKKDWLEKATKAFNEDPQQGVDGPKVHVTLQPMGSGELVQELRNGDLKPQLVSPASELFLQLLEPGVLDPPPYRHLVKSPVVIAMWEDRAKALGWPDKPLGWADVFKLAGSRAGWADYGHNDWGRFKFAHTHPELSNSGLIAVVAQAYAANQKFAGLTLDEVKGDATRELLAGIGRSVSFYGPSTGTMGDQMAASPDLLDACVLYENMVISVNRKVAGRKMVAIYPSEGTFMSDHPVGIVHDVSPAERRAAEKYVSFLLSDAQQQKALEFGFRPGVASVPVGAPINAAGGADPDKPGPGQLLEVPRDPNVILACQEAWRAAKKPANLCLVVGARSSAARRRVGADAETIIGRLGDEDRLSVVMANYREPEAPSPSGKPPGPRFVVNAQQSDKRSVAVRKLRDAIAEMSTDDRVYLVEAIRRAYFFQRSTAQREPGSQLYTIIILSDGAYDNLQPEALSGQIRYDPESFPVTIVPVLYGSEGTESYQAGLGAMEKIASYAGFVKNGKGDPKKVLLPSTPAGQDEAKKKQYADSAKAVINDLSGFLSGRRAAAQ